MSNYNTTTTQVPTPTIPAAPPNTDWWVMLVPFSAEIALGADVRAVGHSDLRNSLNPGEVDFERTLDGVRIPGWHCGVPWFWYRRPTPIITGDDFDPAAIYAATTNPTF